MISKQRPIDRRLNDYVDEFASGRLAMRILLTHCNTVSPL
jgi:hypothetical protein